MPKLAPEVRQQGAWINPDIVPGSTRVLKSTFTPDDYGPACPVCGNPTIAAARTEVHPTCHPEHAEFAALSARGPTNTATVG